LTDGVTSLRPEVELNEFFEFMWGANSGYVYAPIKSPDSEKEEWQTHFFQWPEQRAELIQHVLGYTTVAECYFGPALYRSPGEISKENVLGTQVLWAEFDGNAPKPDILGDKVPHPSMRIKSSSEGHEHFYWHLDYFATDKEFIEDTNRAITYTLHADSSGWDATQILRPPGTKNHKRDKFVRVISQNQTEYSNDFFSRLTVPKKLTKDTIELDEVPDVLSVVAKYKWPAEEFLFFRKNEIPVGSRSSALMRLAYVCAELRMSDEEAFSVLYNADDRWQKFTGRRDRIRRLLDLINKARHKYPLNPEIIIDELQVLNWQELTEQEVYVDWLIPGILQRQGLMLISGKPGVGKTQIMIQLLMHQAMGKPMFNWEITQPRRVVFVSMEMNVVELKVIQAEMDSILTDEERALLQENFHFIPIGQSLLFDSDGDRSKILKMLDRVKPEISSFDSLSKTTRAALDETNSKTVMDFADDMRYNFDTTVGLIHHNRKAQVGNRRPKDLDDIYGSFYLTANPTTVINMWANDKSMDIELSFNKVRLAPQPRTLHIMRQPRGLVFEEVRPDALMREKPVDERPNAGDEPESPSGKANLNI
jgi:KaiC/GvpD/RAD55 family RecA-like ATPase